MLTCPAGPITIVLSRLLSSFAGRAYARPRTGSFRDLLRSWLHCCRWAARRARAAKPREAFGGYKKAAQQDDPWAQWRAARIIYAGLIPGRNLDEASCFLQSSADHGDAFGEYLLGRVKLERQDYSHAAAWFRKAAELGLPQAQEQLAKLLRDGQGVAQDKFEAYVWMLVSNDAGNRRVASDLQALEADLGTNQVEQAKTKAR